MTWTSPTETCYKGAFNNFAFVIPVGWADISDMAESSPSVMYLCYSVSHNGEVKTTFKRPLPDGAYLANVPRYAQDPWDTLLKENAKLLEQQRNWIEREQYIMPLLQDMDEAIRQLEIELENAQKPLD